MRNYRRHPSDGIAWIIGWAFAITVFCVLGYLGVHALSLPTVAVDIEGRCQWIEFSDGVKHIGCGDALPRKYNRIIVGGYR